MTVTLGCYSQQLGTYPFRIGKAVLLRHIWNCPRGAMPWARPVRWHLVDAVDPVTGRHIGLCWSTSSHGEYLNHYLWAEPDAGEAP